METSTCCPSLGPRVGDDGEVGAAAALPFTIKSGTDEGHGCVGEVATETAGAEIALHVDVPVDVAVLVVGIVAVVVVFLVVHVGAGFGGADQILRGVQVGHDGGRMHERGGVLLPVRCTETTLFTQRRVGQGVDVAGHGEVFLVGSSVGQPALVDGLLLLGVFKLTGRCSCVGQCWHEDADEDRND